MDKFKSKVLLTGLVAATLSPNFVAQAVAAETAASDTGDELTEIVVTARRTEENLQDVPISITVFNQQQLENRNVVVAQDLAQYVPSLSVNNNFGGDNTAFALRGFTQDNGTAPSVGVFFGDVIAPRSASNSIPGGDGTGPGSFFDLENVQILKGPQGTLFGRNTTGGDILLVPKKPTSELSGYVEGGVGNYHDGEVQAVVNIPISESFRVRAGVTHETREGYLHSNAPVGPKDFDDINYTAARLSAVLDILPNLENYTIVSYSTTNDNGGIGKLVGADTAFNRTLSVPAQAQLTSQQGSGFYNIEQSLQHPYSRLETWQVINTDTWKATDNLTVKNIASYAQLRDSLADGLFGTYFQTPNNGTPPFVPPYPYGAINIPFIYAASIPLPGSATSNERTMTEELQLQGNALDNRLTYQGGAYFELELPQGYVGSLSPVAANCPDYGIALNCSTVLLFARGFPGLANETVARTKFQDYAFYFQDTYKIIDALKVTTGIRWTHDEEQVDDIQKQYFDAFYPARGPATLLGGLLPASRCSVSTDTFPTCKEHLVQTSRAPTWLIDFDYTPVQDLLLYAKYTRGYREGTINTTAPAQFQYVQPEKVDTYEIGEKFAFHGPVTGTFNGAVFYNDFRNQQIQTGYNPNPAHPGGSPNASPLNAGKSRIWGVELDSAMKLFAGLRLDVGYTYLNTRLQQVTAPTLPPDSLYIIAPSYHAGDELVLSPKNKLSVTPSYTLPLPDTVGALTLAATFTYTSRQLANYQDRSEPALAQFSYLPPTKLLNLDVDWNNILGKPVDLTLFATNVTKQEYYTECNGLGGIPGSNGFEACAVGAPMMFGARVKIRYH